MGPRVDNALRIRPLPLEKAAGRFPSKPGLWCSAFSSSTGERFPSSGLRSARFRRPRRQRAGPKSRRLTKRKRTPEEFSPARPDLLGSSQCYSARAPS